MLRKEENRKRLGIFLISFFLISFFLIRGGITGRAIGIENVEVEEEVFDELERNDKVSVIVVLEDGTVSKDLEAKAAAIKERQDEVLENLNLEDEKGFLGILKEEKEFELNHQYTTINAFSGEVTTEGLKKLENDPNVKKIFFNKVLHPVLDESVPQINADDVWDLSVSGYSITGTAETVCMIDTGIDTDHSAFTGRILGQQCYCYINETAGCCPDGLAESNNAEDNNGHGTHCAGIAAGNYGIYKGVAPEAGIIAIKVCDNNGNCNTDDVIAAIEWCTNNASKYNISVISMSLGGDGPYNTYCDDNSYGIAPGINSAVAEGINVVIAAGNNDWTNGISSPACVENATPAGAVGSSDNIYYNRGNILDLLAPAISITAPYIGGGTATSSGTSMSAPHVAGAIALFRQYWRLAYDQTPTPQQIENKLAITGKLIEDTANSGKNYSRIDVLKAVQPFIEFTADGPINDITLTNNFALINITSDIDLNAALLEWDYNGIIANITMTQKNATSFYHNITGLALGSHTYKVYGNDSVNTFGTTQTRILEVDQTPPNIIINHPRNNSCYKKEFNLNVTITDLVLSSSSYNITGPLGNLIQENSNSNIGGTAFTWTDLVNVSNSTFSDGDYSLTVFANDSLGNSATKTINFSIDKTGPSLFAFDKSPAIVYNNNAVTFYVNVTDENRNDSAVLIEGNWTGDFVSYTISLEAGDRFYYLVSSGNFSNHEKVGYRFYAFDLSGNMNGSELFDFTVQNRIPLANITNPANGIVIEAGDTMQFNASASDPDGDNLTYYWDFDDSTSSSEQNPLKQFNSTGEFTVTSNVSDGYDFNLTSVIVAVNDTQPPESPSISYNDDMYIENSTNQTVNAAIFDYSGIFNVSLYFDGMVKEGSCTKSSTLWNCSWSWVSSYGDYSFTIEAVDNFSVKHVLNQTYDFSFAGCGDEWADDEEECDGSDLGGETCVSQGYDNGTLACSSSCTFDVSSCSSEDSSGEDSEDESEESGGEGSGGGSGSSGGSGTTATTAAEETEEAVEIASEIASETEEGVEEEQSSFASSDTNLAAGESIETEGVKERTSLTGMAVNFLKTVDAWSLKTKVLLGISFFIVILLVLYFVLREKE